MKKKKKEKIMEGEENIGVLPGKKFISTICQTEKAR